MALCSIVVSPWDLVPQIKTLWSLIALAVIVVYYIVTKSRSTKVRLYGMSVVALLAISCVIVSGYLKRPVAEIYRVRVTVVDDKRSVVDDARLTSTFGGEPKKVAGGWEFDIPLATKPQTGQLTVYATASHSLHGETSVKLAADYNPVVTVHLERDESARVIGQVVDDRNRAVAGVRVYVLGRDNESELTGDSGSFDLPAHAAPGEEVRVYAEKQGYEPFNDWLPAGNTNVGIRLVKKRN